MHVYLRDEPVRLRMREVDPEGLVPEEGELVPVAFWAEQNDQPSFRSLLPPETVAVLKDALSEPVTLGLLAEEPDEDGTEIQAMVGLAVPMDSLGEGLTAEEPSESEPWRESVGDPEAWRGDQHDGASDRPESPKTALLAFAPLIRIQRRHPHDFGEELADLLETALAGSTKSVLEARVDRMLGDL